MTTRVCARAFANIALVKYWGKKAITGNIPATPSISLALKALQTITTVERISSRKDRFAINGSRADDEASSRIKGYLDYWRSAGLIDGHFAINSKNDFPTAAGLASSSSGFAALATALSEFAVRRPGMTAISRLARIGSGSAARSVVGGLAAMPIEANPFARSIMAAADIPYGMVIIEVDDATKPVGSRQAMEHCRKTSPFYKNWLKKAARDYRQMLQAIEKDDFELIGDIMENNALAMHACIMSSRPAILYWRPATLRILEFVKKWRSLGLQTYATIDAGPNVILLGRLDDLNKIAFKARRIEGVRKVIESEAGGKAEIIEWK